MTRAGAKKAALTAALVAILLLLFDNLGVRIFR